MHYIRTLPKLIVGVWVVSYALITYAIVSHKEIHLPQNLWQSQLADSQVKLFASKQKIKPEVGQLVICHQQGGSWGFGIVVKQWSDEYYDIATPDNQSVNKHVALSSIKTLSSTWNQLFQPTVSLDKMRTLLDERTEFIIGLTVLPMAMV